MENKNPILFLDDMTIHDVRFFCLYSAFIENKLGNPSHANQYKELVNAIYANSIEVGEAKKKLQELQNEDSILAADVSPDIGNEAYEKASVGMGWSKYFSSRYFIKCHLKRLGQDRLAWSNLATHFMELEHEAAPLRTDGINQIQAYQLLIARISSDESLDSILDDFLNLVDTNYQWEKPKRTWYYLMSPAEFEMSGCDCGNCDPQWSEFEEHLWCGKCEKDFKPSFTGIFDGPIPVKAAEMMGLSFDRFNMQTNSVERFDSDLMEYKQVPGRSFNR